MSYIEGPEKAASSPNALRSKSGGLRDVHPMLTLRANDGPVLETVPASNFGGSYESPLPPKQGLEPAASAMLFPINDSVSDLGGFIGSIWICQ